MIDDNWRDLLRQVITRQSERQRIAQEMNVSPVTLARWATGEFKPRLQSLRLLPQTIPQHYDEMKTLLMKEFGDIFSQDVQSSSVPATDEIPSVFYDRVLQALAQLPKALRTQSLFDLILQQALEHLDPLREGMSISLVHCSPPKPGNPVRSLREGIGIGNPPWKRDLAQKSVFLGADSLSGAIVSRCRPLAIQSPEEGEGLFPAQWFDFEKSAAAAPIMRGGGEGIVGCLLVSSTQKHYFSTVRISLIERYANLLALAFEHNEFFDLAHIELHIMPSAAQQEPLLAEFRQRVLAIIVQTADSSQRLNMVKAEELAWQDIEEDLLNFPFWQHSYTETKHRIDR